MIRASTFTWVNGSVSCLCLPFKQTLARDDLHGLLIASSNEKKCCFLSDSDVFDEVSDSN